MQDNTKIFLVFGVGFVLGTHLGMYFISQCLIVGMVVLLVLEVVKK
jgi:hypothetical protein